MRWISRAIAVLLALLAADFAVVNRNAVTIELWPLPWRLDLPLFAAVLGALLLGLLLGALLVWARDVPVRRRARRQGRSIADLEARLQQAERERRAAEARLPAPGAAAPGRPPGQPVATAATPR